MDSQHYPDASSSLSINAPFSSDANAQQALPEVAWWLPSFIPRYFEVPFVADVNPAAIIRLEPPFSVFPGLTAMREELVNQRNK
jgi:hypothetical protein